MEEVLNEGFDLPMGTPPPWPGVKVDINTEEGAALLGSPNGYGLGFFLVDHRQGGFINRRPKSVVLFTSISFGRRYLNMVFELDDIH